MIYYSSSTGTIIGGTSASDLTGITHLPSGADYAIFVDDTTVNNLNPNNTPGTYSFTGVVAGPVYTVPTATGTLGFTAQSAADQLTAAQNAKKTELQMGCMGTLIGGFHSTATGTQYTYGFADMDQSNMNQEIGMINAGVVASTATINWGIKDGTVVAHTVPQFKQVCTDGYNFKWAQINQLRNLLGQVQSATTVSAVQAITWTPATY